MQIPKNTFSRLSHNQLYFLSFNIFLALAFISLLLISSHHLIGGYDVETDFYGGYAPNAEKMLHSGKYYDEDHGPGYMFPLIALYLVLGNMFTAGKVLSVISAILFILFTFLTIRNLFDIKLAFYTSILLFILIMRYSFLASTDMFFASITSLSVYLIFKNNSINNRNLFWGGLVAGYGFMTRLNAVIIPVAIILGIIFINPVNFNKKQQFQGIALFIAAMILGSLPWYIMNLINYGNLFVSAPQQTIGTSLLAQKAGIARDIAWGAEKEKIALKYPSLFSLIIHNIPLMMKTIIKNIPAHLHRIFLDLIGFPGYVFLGAGAVFLFIHSNKIQLSFLIIPIFGFLIYTIMTYIPRFFIYIAGYLSLIIVYFFFDEYIVITNKAKRMKFKYASLTLFAMVLLFSFQKNAKMISKTISAEPRHIPNVAKILASQSENSDLLLARKPHLGYFSHRQTKIFPHVSSVEELIRYCRQNGVSFIYYGEIEQALYPQLKTLKRVDKLPEGIELVYKNSIPEEYLFKLKPRIPK